MNRKTLAILLVASVAFNVFFAIGYLKARSHIELTRSPEGRTELFLRGLDLDENQMEEARRLRDEYLAEWRESREAKRAEYDRFWAEIVEDDPDEDAIEDFVRSASGVENRERFVRYARAFMKILRPEQRSHVVERMCRHSGRNEKQSEERERRQVSGPAESGNAPDATEAERRKP